MAYDKLVLQVMDKEMIGGPNIVGSIILRLKEIVKFYSFDRPDNGFIWKRIYGAPIKRNNKAAAAKMNADPDSAMCWHGRVLLHYHVEDSKFPKIGVVPLESKLEQLAKEK